MIVPASNVSSAFTVDDRAVSGDLGDRATRFGAGSVAYTAPVFDVVRASGLSPGHDQRDAAIDHLLNGARLQIDRRHAGRRRDEEVPAVGRVGVLVKVQTLAAGLVRQADDAMTGVRIDPLPWHRFLRAAKGHARSHGHARGAATSSWTWMLHPLRPRDEGQPG